MFTHQLEEWSTKIMSCRSQNSGCWRMTIMNRDHCELRQRILRRVREYPHLPHFVLLCLEGIYWVNQERPHTSSNYMVISPGKAPDFVWKWQEANPSSWANKCIWRSLLSNAGSDGTQPEAKVDKAEELMERLKEDAEGAKPWWESPCTRWKYSDGTSEFFWYGWLASALSKLLFESCNWYPLSLFGCSESRLATTFLFAGVHLHLPHRAVLASLVTWPSIREEMVAHKWGVWR